MTVDISALAAAWHQVERVSRIAAAPITDDAALAEATERLEAGFAEIGETTDHPLAGFARTLLGRLTSDEDAHHPIPDVDAAGMLRFLMEQRDLTQRDVTDATGINQSTISQILNRNRTPTADQIRVLSSYFHVQPTVFF